VTHKDDYPEPDALVLSMRKLISDGPALKHGSDVVAPLVLQAHQRVGPPSLGPIVLTREDNKLTPSMATLRCPSLRLRRPCHMIPNIWRSLATFAAPWPVRCATSCRTLFGR
jgi:hypothetical protein